MDRPRSDLFDDPAETAEDALVHDFTLVRRGYDPDEVRDHLARLAVRIEAMEQQLRDATGQLIAVRRSGEDAWRSAYRSAKDDLYGRFAARLTDVLRSADQMADETRREADETSKTTLDAARIEAERTLTEAREHAAVMRRGAEEARDRAETERETILLDLESRRGEIVREIRVAADRLSDAVERLYEFVPQSGDAQAPFLEEDLVLDLPELEDIGSVSPETDTSLD
jgi:DivIVA domain-containing protein